MAVDVMLIRCENIVEYAWLLAHAYNNVAIIVITTEQSGQAEGVR